MTSIGAVLPGSLSCPYDESSPEMFAAEAALAINPVPLRRKHQMTVRRAAVTPLCATLAAPAAVSPAANVCARADRFRGPRWSKAMVSIAPPKSAFELLPRPYVTDGSGNRDASFICKSLRQQPRPSPSRAE
jgi:hypothetical protein